MPTPGRPRLLLPLVLLAVGCSDRPKAPPLVNEAVYQNDTIGLRFLTPEGWTIASRASLPPGQLPRPVALVTYRLPRAEKAADFELMAADIPEGEDLGRFLAEHRIGPEKWAPKGPPREVAVGGIPATKYAMTRGRGKDEQLREATAVRRAGRVYFFVLTFAANDPESRSQAHHIVDSATWTK